ncbi:hypothetical protein Tco_0370954 [Tanacetum coccineum]
MSNSNIINGSALTERNPVVRTVEEDLYIHGTAEMTAWPHLESKSAARRHSLGVEVHIVLKQAPRIPVVVSVITVSYTTAFLSDSLPVRISVGHHSDRDSCDYPVDCTGDNGLHSCASCLNVAGGGLLPDAPAEVFFANLLAICGAWASRLPERCSGVLPSGTARVKSQSTLKSRDSGASCVTVMVPLNDSWIMAKDIKMGKHSSSLGVGIMKRKNVLLKGREYPYTLCPAGTEMRCDKKIGKLTPANSDSHVNGNKLVNCS